MTGNNKNIANAILTIIVLGVTAIIVKYFGEISSYAGKLLRLTYPFIIGLAIAYVLTPITNKVISKLKKGKLKNKSYKSLNTIAIIIVETVFIVALVTIITCVLTGVIESGYTIVLKLPSAYEQFKDMLDDLIKSHKFIEDTIGHTSAEVVDNIASVVSPIVIDNFEDILSNLLKNTQDIGRYIINFVFGVVISIFVLANRAQFKNQSLKILRAVSSDKVYNKIVDIFIMINSKFSGFFTGKLIDSAIIGIICLVCMTIMRMPYVMLVSIIIFITNIIPIIGPIIGAIPSIVIIFSESPIQAVYFAIFILILQQIDGHIIGPKCIGSAIGLNTFYVLFALIVSGGLWGITGMLIGVPLFSVIYSLIAELVNYLLVKYNRKI